MLRCHPNSILFLELASLVLDDGNLPRTRGLVRGHGDIESLWDLVDWVNLRKMKSEGINTI